MPKKIEYDKLLEDNGQEGEWVKTKGGVLFRKPKKKEVLQKEETFPIKGEGFVASEPFHGKSMPWQGVEFRPGASSEELKQAKEEIETAFKNAKKEKET